ncbi:MAG: hypothetical protein AAGJ83_08155 [Planctomycetota bacterium]
MRDDEIDIEVPHGFDRPGDAWMESDGQLQRTWFGNKRRVTLFALAAFVAACLLLLAFVPKSRLWKPGALSSPHAQILAGTITQERCGACHVEASRSPIAWLADSHDAVAVTQTDLCMDCHHQRIPRKDARRAHNLPSTVRKQLTMQIRSASLESLPSRTKLQDIKQNEEIACSVCHREHHGKAASLIDLSDAQCQTCHSQRIQSFATDHPEWQDWPYGRSEAIAFDHSTHAFEHYPKSDPNASFDCRRCHAGPLNRSSVGASSDLSRSVSYEQAC